MPVKQSSITVRGLQFTDSPVRENGIYAVAGRNFMPVRDGVREAFGAHLESVIPIKGDYVEQFEIQGNTVYLTENGAYGYKCDRLYEYASFCRQIKKEPCDFDYPWSHAFLGDSYFFCHPSVGIVEFDVKTGEWSQFELRTMGFSDLVFSITEANGSLIVLSRDTVTYSSFQNGRALIENEYEGVASQSLHLARFGRPLAVMSDGFGFFTFTTNGVMYSQPFSSAQVLSGENVEGSAVFKHREFSVDATPLNAFSIVSYNKSLVVFLSSEGLQQVGRFENNQFTSKPFTLEFSRWLNEEIFPCENYTCETFSRLAYSDVTKRLYVSLRIGPVVPLHNFNLCYVYDGLLQQWGSFNMPHKQITVHPFTQGRRKLADGYLSHMNLIHTFDSSLTAVRYDFNGNLLREASWVELGYVMSEDQTDADYLFMMDKLRIETKGCAGSAGISVQVNTQKRTCRTPPERESTQCILEPYKTENCVFYYRNTKQGVYHSVLIDANGGGAPWYIRTLNFAMKKRGKLS